MLRKKWKGVPKEIYAALIVIQKPVCPICDESIEVEIDEYKLWLEESKTARNKFGYTKRRGEIDLNVDHLIPVSRGGQNDITNLRLVHRQCNTNKGDCTLEEFKAGKRPAKKRAKQSTRKERKSVSVSPQIVGYKESDYIIWLRSRGLL